MNVDTILADPHTATELPAGAIPLHAIIIIEYANPGSDTVPERTRCSIISDEDLSMWGCIGLLRFALQRELDDVTTIDTDDDPMNDEPGDETT